MNENYTVLNVAGDEEGFKALRKTHIGSSDISTIVGLNRFSNKYELWLEKTGRVPDKEVNQAMLMGNILEPVVAQVFKLQYMGEMGEYEGFNLEPCQNTYAMTSPFEFVSCTPDYFLTDPAGQKYIFEVKTTSEYGRKDWETALPDHAHVQVIWQMGILGLKRAVVCCLVGGRDLVVWPVDFSQELFEQLLSHAVSFWKMVEENIPPETDSKPVTLKEFDEESADLPTMEPLMEAYLKIKKEQSDHAAVGKGLEAKAKAIKAKIMLEMGRYGRVNAGNYFAIKKEVSRDGYSVKPSKYTDLTVKPITADLIG